MKFGLCKGCGFMKNLTRHSEIGGHAEGHGYTMICRECHDKIHGCEQRESRKKARHQKGSGGKFAKGTRRRK